MLKLVTFAIIGTLSFTPAAFAKGHDNGNDDAARGMAAALKGGGGGNNSPLKDEGALDLPGKGGVASYVSGGGNGGWGNVGSGLLPSGQVSKRNK